MSIYLEITQLENGDIVLREAEDEADEGEPRKDIAPRAAHSTSSVLPQDREPLVRISFSEEVKDLLGGELVGVAEAMIDAATDFLGGETIELDPESPPAPTIH